MPTLQLVPAGEEGRQQRDPAGRIGIPNLVLAPFAPEGSAEGRAGRGSPEPGAARLPAGSRVLIVDDDNDTRTICRLVLERQGVEVREAPDGAQGLAAAREWQPHLVLLDLCMPGLSGWEVLHAMRSSASLAHLPVVILTAHLEAANRERALAAGCLGYLTKPLQMENLLRTIGRALTAECDPLPVAG